ncbi:MAG: thiol-disulfide oxidoreductase DCC family protein [Bacteriovoracia bacterium]
MVRPPSVILFDGVCNLCNGFVDFVVRRDTHRRFRFASLPGGEKLDSIALLQDGRRWERSAAVLKVLGGLGLPWSLFSILRAVPRPVRDAVYDWIARNRYLWFGKRDTCRLPTAEEKTLFLTDAELRSSEDGLSAHEGR